MFWVTEGVNEVMNSTRLLQQTNVFVHIINTGE